MAEVKQRVEHHFDDQGKPEGIVTTVEKVPYLGYHDGKPSYGESSRDFWRSACITTWIGIILYVIYSLVPHSHLANNCAGMC